MDDRRFTFAEFEFHSGRRALTRGGVPVAIGSRALDVLLALLRRHGQIATKHDIIAEAWDGLQVAQNNLTTQMAMLRRALNDPQGRRLIQTVPGRGYRFVGDIITCPATAPPPPAEPAERHNLPIECSSFIGRERELADLTARLAMRALVTVVGAGGVGKTRAARKLAADQLETYADGVLLLELAPLSDPALVAELLCRKLGVTPSADCHAIDAAVAVLRGRALLLVLDNCEHLLTGVAPLALAVLLNCPHIRLLVTSREALGIPGELTYRLPALAVPPRDFDRTAATALRSDAVRLFAERAADTLGSYTLTDADAPAVVTICRRLEGVPLAMELAAARLSMLNPGEIAARLENVFRLLNLGSRTALPRHRTLYATIDWSFSLLSAAEQVLLRRLAVFVDGCCLAGAVAVAACGDIPADAVFDLLSALVSKSLVVPDTSGPTTRYRMLETTRQYAAEKLGEAGETGLRQNMALWVLDLARRAEAAWPTAPTDDWVATYGAEAENFRAAIDWAFATRDTELGVALVANAGALADEKSLQSDLRRWTGAALPHIATSPSRTEAAAVLYLHTLQEKRLGACAVPIERQQCIAAFRAAGDALRLSRALRQTAMARAMPGPADPGVLAMASEAVELLRPLAPHKDLATALAHLGSVHFFAGEQETARRLNEEALAMRRGLGDRSGMLASSVNLSELLYWDGDVGAALQYAAAAEAEARRCNALGTLALILSNLAGYRLHENDVSGAAVAAAEALRLSRALGLSHVAVMCLEHLALVLVLQGALDVAAGLTGFTDAHYRASGQTRERLEQAGFERLETSLQGARFDRLRAAGAAWSAQGADAAALQEG